MNEFNITNKEKAKAKNIRRQYIDQKQNKIDQLQKLDSKVKALGRICLCAIKK